VLDSYIFQDSYTATEVGNFYLRKKNKIMVSAIAGVGRGVERKETETTKST
jgi:hypothetical protein